MRNHVDFVVFRFIPDRGAHRLDVPPEEIGRNREARGILFHSRLLEEETHHADQADPQITLQKLPRLKAVEGTVL
jgi:hypothetical protein